MAPAAVAGRAVTSNRLCGAVFGALYQAMPAERVMASCNDSTSAVSISGWHSGRGATYVYPESMGGGAGAFGDRDGMDAVHVHTVNSTNLPAEALELEYPLLLEEYCLVPDSGGAGRHRGGMGMARQIRIREDNTTFSARSDAHIIPAPGVSGGKASNVTRILRNAVQGVRPDAGGRRGDPRRDAGRRWIRRPGRAVVGGNRAGSARGEDQPIGSGAGLWRGAGKGCAFLTSP
jgi:N-methylhydantoinase B